MGRSIRYGRDPSPNIVSTYEINILKQIKKHKFSNKGFRNWRKNVRRFKSFFERQDI